MQRVLVEQQADQSSKQCTWTTPLSFSKVRALPKTRLAQLQHLTHPNYEKYLMARPGLEHYTLLEYLMQHHCPTVVDIGTRYIASALALATHGVVVDTVDIPISTERQTAFRGTRRKGVARQGPIARFADSLSQCQSIAIIE